MLGTTYGSNWSRLSLGIAFMNNSDTSHSRFDAVTLQVLWTRLISIVNEASAALVRTSFSTIVRETYDFSVILTDDRGHGIVQPPASIPAFIGTLPATVRHFLAKYPLSTLKPGDILITNDPWKGTGHLADVSLAKPIFLNGQVVGFAASVAHASDMGGRTGSTESRDVFEEGFQIPVMRLCSEGIPDSTLIKLLRTNVRAPDEVEGDLWAQVSALELIESRLIELMLQYEIDSLKDLAADIHDRSEKAMRVAIRAIPDGFYDYSLTTDGVEDPIQICISIEVHDDELSVNYKGTSPQVDKALNAAFCYTYAYTMFGLKCVLAPEIPNNEGIFRPIRIFAPEGSVLNHRFPTSGCSRSMLGHYLPFAVFGAFSQVVPERIIAGSGSPIWSVLMRGQNERGETFANKFFYNGGTGASYRRDGMSATSWPSNISLTPTEVIEQSVPCRVIYKQLRPNSSGAGEYRGGQGQDVMLENRSDTPIFMVFLAERTKNPAPGIAGGEPGECGALLIDGEICDPKKQHVLKPNGTVLLRTPGGGGYGSSINRRNSIADITE